MRIALGLLLCLGSTAVQAQTPKVDPNRHTFDSNGVKIHYLDRGAGEPVILIHGFGANLDVNWAGMVPRLVDDFRVIAVDNRGHGRSDKPHDSDSYGIDMVEDVLRLMDHLEIPRAHIVGYSMGSLISGKFLAEHPNRCISVVIGGMGWLEVNDQWKAFIEEVATSLESGNGPMPLLKFLFAETETGASEQQLNVINSIQKVANDQLALAACARQFPEFQISKESLESNKVPVLAIVGDKDPFKEYVDRMDGVMANMEIVVVPGGDHLTTIRNPIFLNGLKEFLVEHRESAPAPTADERKTVGSAAQ